LRPAFLFAVPLTLAPLFFLPRAGLASLPAIPGDARIGRTALGDDDRRLRHESFVGDFEPGDGRDGDWSRERLIRMDEKFRERLAQALRRGLESLDGAIGIASGR